MSADTVTDPTLPLPPVDGPDAAGTTIPGSPDRGEAIPGIDGSVSDAPYGLKADGTPKAKPGRPTTRQGRAQRARRASTRTAPPPPKRPASASSAPGKAKGPDYAAGVMGLLQIPAAGLAVAGQVRPELAADSAALLIYGPPMANAIAELAAQDARIAAVLDRIMAAGPYGALIAAAVPLVAQIMVNHDLLPAGLLGTASKDEMIRAGGGVPPQEADKANIGYSAPPPDPDTGTGWPSN